MMFEARAAWAHEFVGPGGIRLRFERDPFAHGFTITPPSQRQDSAVLGLGFAGDAGASFRFLVDFGGEVGGPSRVWGGTVGVSRSW